MDNQKPSVATTRLGLMIGVPLAIVLGVNATSWALSLKTWNSGDTLTATDLNANFDAVNAELTRMQSTPWTALPLNTATFTNYGVGFNAAQYKRVGDLVYVRGLVTGALAGDPLIATLPAGFRPNAANIFAAETEFGAHRRVDVHSTGEIKLYSNGASGTSYVSLDGIVFSVD